MNLARRLFFKRAAGAVAAGPLALEAVASEVDKMALGFTNPPPTGGNALPPSWNGEKDWIVSRLKELASPETRPLDHVGRLDPDLVANRSMSLVARMRIQAAREQQRYAEREVKSLLERLAKL